MELSTGVTTRELQVDVAVVGAGPTGLVATALLGRRHRVALIERQATRYSLPRAGHIDHEIMRVLQGLDANRGILEDQQPAAAYNWVNGERQTLVSFPWDVPSVSGFQNDYMMYQPELETGVYEAIERAACEPLVEMGWEVVDITQDADGATITSRRRDRGPDGSMVLGDETTVVRAAYVVVADGANSPTRSRLGIEQTDYGFSERWLDVDVLIKRELPESLRRLDVLQVCDPERPTLLAPLGKRHYRWEWMLFDDETIEEFEQPEKAWELLAEWDVTPDHVEILRDLVYQFEARVAETWRQGRIFLLGDAVHTMPPHMGQGMCSGIRDSANLAWKLDLVLREIASDELLESYESERRPHADAWIQISKAMGEISCTVDPGKAAERDAALLRGEIPPMPEFPVLTTGALNLDENGTPVGLAGQLFLQAEVDAGGGRRGLFHDVFGHGFHLVGSADPRAALRSEDLDLLERLGVTCSWLADAADGGGAFVDVGGGYRELFAGRAAMIVRPDYYVYGEVARLEDLSGLIQDLAQRASLTGPKSPVERLGA